MPGTAASVSIFSNRGLNLAQSLSLTSRIPGLVPKHSPKRFPVKQVTVPLPASRKWTDSISSLIPLTSGRRGEGRALAILYAARLCERLWC